jgi:mannose-1-phosphate guanylyltransferase
LQRCAILEGSTIRDHAWVRNSIVGWNSTVGRWARVDNFTVLGDDVAIRDELFVNGASGAFVHPASCLSPPDTHTVLPHKSVSTSITEPGAFISRRSISSSHSSRTAIIM